MPFQVDFIFTHKVSALDAMAQIRLPTAAMFQVYNSRCWCHHPFWAFCKCPD